MIRTERCPRWYPSLPVVSQPREGQVRDGWRWLHQGRGGVGAGLAEQTLAEIEAMSAG